MMSPCRALNAFSVARSRAIDRRRRQLGEAEHQELLGVVAHPERVVDDQRPRVDALEDVGRGDVAHVEGRVLAQPDHVLAGEVDRRLVPEREVVALLAPHLDRPAARRHPAVVERQPVGRVVEEPVPARLRLLHDPEGGIGGDVDPLDRIHLDGDVQAHALPPARLAPRAVMAEPPGGGKGAEKAEGRACRPAFAVPRSRPSPSLVPGLRRPSFPVFAVPRSRPSPSLVRGLRRPSSGLRRPSFAAFAVPRSGLAVLVAAFAVPRSRPSPSLAYVAAAQAP